MRNHICSERKKENKVQIPEGNIDRHRYYKIQVTSSRWHNSSQQTDVVHKALHKILILVLWIACHSELTLATNLSGGDFNFKLVLELILARLLLLQVRRLLSGFLGNIGILGTYLGFGYLSQVHLICQMAVAHAIFDALASACYIYHWECADVARVLHFEVDTYAPIHCGAWTAHIYVGNSTFDDFGEDFSGTLVGGHTNFGLVARVQILTDDWG
jgi:hypothetical protein